MYIHPKNIKSSQDGGKKTGGKEGCGGGNNLAQNPMFLKFLLLIFFFGFNNPQKCPHKPGETVKPKIRKKTVK